jgi:hypothetical protein
VSPCVSCSLQDESVSSFSFSSSRSLRAPTASSS